MPKLNDVTMNSKGSDDDGNSDGSINETIRPSVQVNKRCHSELSPSTPSPTQLDAVLAEVRHGFAEMKKEQRSLSDKFNDLKKCVGETTLTAHGALEKAECVEVKVSKLEESCAKMQHSLEAIKTASPYPWREDMDRALRCADVVIRGIPVKRDTTRATLRSFPVKIAAALGVRIADCDVHYVRVLLQRKTNNPSLIVRFTSVAVRDTVFSAYFRGNMKLCTSSIGLTTKSPIFISDNLLPSVNTLKNDARKLRDNGVVSKISTRNGILSVQLTNGSGKWLTINTAEDLLGLSNSLDVDQALHNLSVSDTY